jgi:hypothetical protein
MECFIVEGSRGMSKSQVVMWRGLRLLINIFKLRE